MVITTVITIYIHIALELIVEMPAGDRAHSQNVTQACSQGLRTTSARSVENISIAQCPDLARGSQHHLADANEVARVDANEVWLFTFGESYSKQGAVPISNFWGNSRLLHLSSSPHLVATRPPPKKHLGI